MAGPQVLAAPRGAGAASAAVRRCWALLAALLAVAAANLRLQVPWVPEAMYLETTFLAALVTTHRLLHRRPRPPLLPWPALAAVGVALMALCLPLDPLLCAVGGPWLGATPVLFGGSVLGFAAIVGLAGGSQFYGRRGAKAD